MGTRTRPHLSEEDDFLRVAQHYIIVLLLHLFFRVLGETVLSPRPRVTVSITIPSSPSRVRNRGLWLCPGLHCLRFPLFRVCLLYLLGSEDFLEIFDSFVEFIKLILGLLLGEHLLHYPLIALYLRISSFETLLLDQGTNLLQVAGCE